MNWIELIKPYTKRILIDHKHKSIMLVHPHFNPGKRNLFNLLHELKKNPVYKGYTIEAVGFASIKGILILKSIEKFLNKLEAVESVNLNASISTAMYNLKVKFKKEY